MRKFVLYVLILIVSTWFYFPNIQFSNRGKYNFSKDILSLYFKICQIPGFITVKFLNINNNENPGRRERAQENRRLNFIFVFIIPSTVLLCFIFEVFYKYRRKFLNINISIYNIFKFLILDDIFKFYLFKLLGFIYYSSEEGVNFSKDWMGEILAPKGKKNLPFGAFFFIIKN